MAYPDLLQTAIKAASDFNPDSILIEDAGSGTSLIADLDVRNISAKGIRNKGDNESRLSRVSAMIENGNVYLPAMAHWKDDFMLEVLSFPNGRKRRSGGLHDPKLDLNEG